MKRKSSLIIYFIIFFLFTPLSFLYSYFLINNICNVQKHTGIISAAEVYVIQTDRYKPVVFCFSFKEHNAKFGIINLNRDYEIFHKSILKDSSITVLYRASESEEINLNIKKIYSGNILIYNDPYLNLLEYLLILVMVLIEISLFVKLFREIKLFFK